MFKKSFQNMQIAAPWPLMLSKNFWHNPPSSVYSCVESVNEKLTYWAVSDLANLAQEISYFYSRWSQLIFYRSDDLVMSCWAKSLFCICLSVVNASLSPSALSPSFLSITGIPPIKALHSAKRMGRFALRRQSGYYVSFFEGRFEGQCHLGPQTPNHV